MQFPKPKQDKTCPPYKPDAKKIRALMTGCGMTAQEMIDSGKARENYPNPDGDYDEQVNMNVERREGTMRG